ncbi:sugar ABC transporter substrate-binding protein [Amorphoplanes nipponensis]|uniref:Sugar ABC transporter substrate-binding protein n=2 Tax=Actinoplanes nipponensis TaxID=135950 RepID=A0A919JH54_9ACTN|nr:extracellular solute-binding protein [Actinoplanes nipponensis]GIE48972.1 sugar ABC transporter substrate-binding protein [Actinoplanes nipponensis]
MERSPISRRTFLSLTAAAGAGAALAACGSSGPGGGSSGGGSASTASYWFLTGQPGEGIRQAAAERFNKANPNNKLQFTAFENDAYKQKIKTAIGAGQAPTLIWGWGGGGLKSYVDAGQVEDLTDWFGQNAAVKDKLFPSSFGPATINGKIYAMPCETVQPIILYYNKKVFEQAGAKVPQSFEEMMALVPTFKNKGIAPFSLAGKARWTNMMWLEFLLDRIGGPDVFNAVFAGEKDAWSNPAVLDMLTKIQGMVAAGAFGKGFSSVDAAGNADQALLYTGKAAMMLHGGWTYGSMKNDGGKFVSSGQLGWMNFPPVEGGKGDPADTVGNPGQYLAISSKASAEQKETAKKFFQTGVLDQEEVKAWVNEGGSVPVVKGTESVLAASPDADFLKFVYDTSVNAKVFAQSWDQALSPTAAEALLDNIAKLFQNQVSPQQWVTNMNQVIGK